MQGSLAHCYNLKSLVYQKKGNLVKALEQSNNSLEISQSNKDLVQLSTALSNVGIIYWSMKDTLNAIQYFEDALLLMDSTHSDPLNIASVKANLAGAQPFGQKKLNMINDAIQFNKKHGFTNYQAYTYFFLADYYDKGEKDYEKAVKNYHLALDYARESSDASKLGQISIHLGLVYKELDILDSAQYYLEQGLEVSKDLGLEFDQEIGSKGLSEIYAQQNEHKKAYALMNDSYELQKQIFNTDLANQSSFASAEYESEKKEAEIVRQQLEIERQVNSRRLWIGGGAALITLLSLGFFGVYQTNKRKRAEAEMALSMEQQRSKDLENLSELKTTFFNNVSHELRTPLTMVIAPLKDLSDKIKNVNYKKDVDLALTNSKRLLTLTNEILDLSKLEENKIDLTLSDIEISSFLKRTFHSFDSLAKSRRITLKSEILDKDIWIKTDVKKLEKIVINLVGNAIKYSPDESHVTLKLNLNMLDNSILHINIIDNGYGISHEDQNHIFDRFYQSDRMDQSSGTGIGLALVKEYVHLLGGEISLKSDIDKGSTFSIILKDIEIIKPAEISNTESTADANNVINGIKLNGRKPHILIVEDDLEMSKYLSRILTPHFECDTAFSGIQALDKLQKTDYDLITSDVMMPEMNGFELREKINDHPNWKDIPFVMLTARSMEEDKLRGFRMGIDDYITKPFNTSEYLARVQNLLQNKKKRIAFSEEEEEVDFDSEFINNAQEVVLNHIDNTQFSVKEFAKEMNYSSRQLGRILQKLTGYSPVTFILEMRLQKAYELISKKQFKTISEVMHEVGIESASYFATKFTERFGINPSQVN